MGILLATIVALAAFFWQTTACHAEHAGLIPCHEQAGDAATASEIGESDCCPTEPNTFAGHLLPSATSVSQPLRYHSRPFGAPDGPVAEIEYPPQILS